MFSGSHVRRPGLARPSAVVAVVLGGSVAALIAVVALLPRVIRGHWEFVTHSDTIMRFFKAYNDFTRKTSGSRHSPFALLTHVGRRSGHTYQTSLGACAYGDGFLLPLGYGSGTDWCRNVLAAGVASLGWKGQTHELERPEIISGSEVIRAWPARQQLTLRLAGIHDFLWLHNRSRRPQPTEAGLGNWDGSSGTGPGSRCRRS